MSWLLLIVIFGFMGLIAMKKPKGKNAQERKEWMPPAWAPQESKKKWGKADWGNTNKTEPKPKYWDKFQLLNKSEQILYNRLREATPALLVFSQVSMSQLFHITSEKKHVQLKEIGKKSVDFLLCREDTSIVMAIELNGPMHDQENQIFSDKQKRDALEDAGIPLAVFKPNEIPDVPELRRILAPYIVERRSNEAERNERMKQAKTSKSSSN